MVGTSSFDNTTPASIVPLRIAAQDADLEEAFAVTNSKVLKGSAKREESMKALELLLQYGTVEQKEKARAKLVMVSGIGNGAHSSSSSEEESEEDSNDESEFEHSEEES